MPDVDSGYSSSICKCSGTVEFECWFFSINLIAERIEVTLDNKLLTTHEYLSIKLTSRYVGHDQLHSNTAKMV